MWWNIRLANGKQIRSVSGRRLRRWVFRREAAGSYAKRDGDRWYRAEVIRDRLKRLRREGIYLRSDHRIVGPLSSTRAALLIQTSSNGITHWRRGTEGEWKEAFTFLDSQKP